MVPVRYITQSQIPRSLTSSHGKPSGCTLGVTDLRSHLVVREEMTTQNLLPRRIRIVALLGSPTGNSLRLVLEQFNVPVKVESARTTAVLVRVAFAPDIASLVGIEKRRVAGTVTHLLVTITSALSANRSL